MRISAFLIPRNDEFMGEYVPARSERLSYISGFTGSAGTLVVTHNQATLFTDGRYTIQARSEMPKGLFQQSDYSESSPLDWLLKFLSEGDRIGFDPKLHTAKWTHAARRKCEEVGIILTPCTPNPVDLIWLDRPEIPRASYYAHDLRYAGKSSNEKCADIIKQLKKRQANALVITNPESVAWLLNFRGNDVAYTPLPLCTAILHDSRLVELFGDPDKIDAELCDHFGDRVQIQASESFVEALTALGNDRKRVQLDPSHCSAWVETSLREANAHILNGDDPIALPRACKNDTESRGARQAHIRDGVALCRFLAWLDHESPRETLTEIDAAEALLSFRAAGEHFRGLSFATISAAGPNGAIVHYRVTHKTNRRLETGNLFLLDSGAQYLDGTTDVTRTIAIGKPSTQMRHHNTAVLKGHIALAMALFPEGTTGSQLDVLARQPLWNLGLDYNHGTGHGVGSYLSVHEGPQRISKSANGEALKLGMILSNEPGYYREGAYGIRIENLVQVIEKNNEANGTSLGFDTLTRAPFDRRLIDTAALTQAERDWIDAYHQRVRDDIAPHLEAIELAWLEDATAAL